MKVPQDKPITADIFRQATGHDPELDDLDRVNCPDAGMLCHHMCGWNYKLNCPMFVNNNEQE